MMADGSTGSAIVANRALTDSEYGLLQRYIDTIMEKIAAEGFSLVIETNFSQLIEFLESVSYPVLNPTYNPETSDLSRDAFWLRVIDKNGVTVACHAERIFTTDDFFELMTSGRLWHRDGVTWREDQEPLEISRTERPLFGRVAHAGSLWIRPAARKRGLSLYLPYLSRALCLRNYGTDFHTGVVLPSLAGSVVPTMAYGYSPAQVHPCIRGWFPVTRRFEELVYLCHMSRAEGVAGFHALPEHPQYPISVPGQAAPAGDTASDSQVEKLTRIDADH